MIGFEEIEQKLFSNFDSNKFHHGIIISGKKGIGKASFIKNFCNKILNEQSPPNHNASNIDLAIAEKLPDKKTIGIEIIRQNQQFLNHTAGISEYKFLIVDAVCELTKQASNALLKSLEEPKKNCFIILIAHQLNKVLPTIKSRCLIIKVPDFSNSQFNSILENKGLNLGDIDQKFLSQICENCPALAINYGEDLIKFYRGFIDSLANKKIANDLLKMLGDKNFSFLVIEKVVLFFIAQLIKKNHNLPIFIYCPNDAQIFDDLSANFSLNNQLDLYDNVSKSLENAVKSNLDKKINFINIFNQICYV